MKTKLTFLLSLTFLFLFSGSVYGNVQKDLDASQTGDYKEFLRSPEGLQHYGVTNQQVS
jgi:hypothetical protein